MYRAPRLSVRHSWKTSTWLAIISLACQVDRANGHLNQAEDSHGNACPRRLSILQKLHSVQLTLSIPNGALFHAERPKRPQASRPCSTIAYSDLSRSLRFRTHAFPFQLDYWLAQCITPIPHSVISTL
ncbi:uncharacterized protein MYCFIDRAFT_208851 [Pseudocercospora fijiensis CIRAD86]|uniref:Secreted protein n=1 Tax=Pseudocercospora fijiensis (strain CIRAD86) TaxID=383855 RepID=M2ZKL4_PSEFD|nr:uncharacterized protein MYCFIDRAFT_208851 [Pseudocercospora fijiensis CIRAD86]EME79619.1 hypothetical protein MYCFIDRAFT_208851 [Pseudocercospora fijiensis CIRAD86]